MAVFVLMIHDLVASVHITTLSLLESRHALLDAFGSARMSSQRIIWTPRYHSKGFILPSIVTYLLCRGGSTEKIVLIRLYVEVNHKNFQPISRAEP
jgi:hypothetical protein